MISRTVLEWKSLPYGDGADRIPEWAADRLAAVARRSALAGRGGTHVLSHGRNALRAAQVVGIIAARDCALEILPKIDFTDTGDDTADVGRTRRQLVHMLAVALDIEIDVGAITALDWQKENLLEILIRVFGRKLADAIRQGMPRRYIAVDDDLPVLRGKLNATRQFTRLAATPNVVACRFDELTPDFAINQLMKAVLKKLLGIARSQTNQRLLNELAFAYADIADVDPTVIPRQQLTTDRINALWRELVNLALLLLGDHFQKTSQGDGQGFALLFEMNLLFEEYISRLIKRAMNGTGFTVSSQGGRRYCLIDPESAEELFITRPDILIRDGPSIALIIDTKWKRLASSIDDKKQGVSQGDIYQMMAYGQIYGCAHLMLLYPHHLELGRPEGVLSKHRVQGSENLLCAGTFSVADRSNLTARIRSLVRDTMPVRAERVG